MLVLVVFIIWETRGRTQDLRLRASTSGELFQISVQSADVAGRSPDDIRNISIVRQRSNYTSAGRAPLSRLWGVRV